MLGAILGFLKALLFRIPDSTTGKWKVSLGVERDTGMESEWKDTPTEYFDTYMSALAGARETWKSYFNSGYDLVYAWVISPEGIKQSIKNQLT